MAALIARADELATLRRAVNAAGDGHGDVVVIEGDAGTGKSRLLAEFVTELRALEVDILFGSVTELSGARPFGLFLDAFVADDTSELYRLAHRRATAVDVGFGRSDHFGSTVDAFVEAIEELTSTRPVVVIVDDVQWADEASMTVLGALVSRARRLPLTIIGAYRPTPRPRELAAVIDDAVRSGGTEVALTPLDHASVLALANELLEAPPGPTLLDALRAANGNPLFVTELIRGAHDERRLVATPDGVDLAEPGLPGSLRRLVERRLQRLAPDVADLLRHAALLGTICTAADLAAVAGFASVSSLRPLLINAFEHAVLTDEGRVDGDIVFQHDLVRDAVFASVPRGVRSAMHRDAAAALLSDRPSSLTAAHQILRITDDIDPTDVASFVSCLRAVAADVVGGAPHTASELLRRAIAITSRDGATSDPRHPNLVAELGRALFWAGELEESERVVTNELAREQAPALTVELLGVHAEAMFITGRLGDAADAFAQLAHQLATPEAGHRLSEAATACLLSGRLDRAAELATDALALSTERHSLPGELEARNTLSWTQCLRGHLDAGIEMARTSVARAEAADDAGGDRTVPWLFLAQALSWADQSEDAQSTYARARHKTGLLGVSWYEPLIAAALSGELLQCGLWDDALAEAESIIAYSHDTQAKMTDAWAYAAIAHVERRRGNIAAATGALHAGRELGESGVAQGRDIITAEAARFLATSDPDGAASLMLLLWQILDGYDIALRMWEIAPDLVTMLRAVDRQDDVDAVLERLRALDGQDVGVTRLVSLARSVAIGTDDVQPVLQLIERLDGAASLVARPVLWSELNDTAAVICARQGLEAAAFAGVALDGYDALGAVADAGRLRSLLSDLGLAVPTTEPGSDDWALLTKSEWRVITLLTKGLTNREIADRLFLSRRTVESHLHHAYTKLGFGSRTELAVAAFHRLSGSGDEAAADT